MSAPMTRRGEALRAAVDAVHAANLRTYGSDEAQASIKTAVARSFSLPGVFLFELVQNALDLGATSIRIAATEHEVVVEHNAKEKFNAASIEALSKLGMSTKHRLDTVGFMGLGFKSIFQRFERVEISDRDLRMFFEVGHVDGLLGTRFRKWIDLVLPRWDDAIAPPSERFTTRFCLRLPVDTRPLAEDVAALAPADESPHALALLALRGLKRIEIDGRTWRLKSAPDALVSAISDGTRHDWLAVRQSYRPSAKALRRLLEHRDWRIEADPDRQLEREREVVALLPLDARGVPDLPERGHVYATLPTDVRLDLRLLLQADWLLNLGRDGLIDPRSDPWQREIVAAIPQLLAKLFTWLGERASAGRPDVLRAGIELVADLDPTSRDLGGAIASVDLRSRIAAALNTVAFVPVAEGEDDVVACPSEVAAIPGALAQAFRGESWMLPSLAFGCRIIEPDLVLAANTVVESLAALGLTQTIDAAALKTLWPQHLDEWWALHQRAAASSEAHREKLARVMVALLAGLERLSTPQDRTWTQLASVPNGESRCVPPAKIIRYAYPMPAPTSAVGRTFHEQLQAAFLSSAEVVSPMLEQALAEQNSELAAAARRLLMAGPLVQPHDRVAQAVDAAATAGRLTPHLAVAVALWARGAKKPAVVRHVVVSSIDGRPAVAPASRAVLADTYTEDAPARRAVFVSRLPISTDYLKADPDVSAWRAFFETVPGVAGPVRLVEQRQHLARWGTDETISDLGVEPFRVNNDGYVISDWDWEDGGGLRLEAPEFGRWLERGFTTLRDKAHVRVSGEWRRYTYTSETPRACAWVTRLIHTPWVLTTTGNLKLPRDVVLVQDEPDQPLAAMSAELAHALQAAGVYFGGAIPKAPPLRRLKLRGPTMSALELALELRAAIAQANDAASKDELRRLVLELEVPHAGPGRVPVGRLVRKAGGARSRSALRGFVVTLDEVELVLRSEVERVPGLSIPDTTTGWQALALLRSIWRRADRGEIAADEARRVLPQAYEYVTTDAVEDQDLARELASARAQLRISTGRGWHSVGDPPQVVVDDLNDPDLRALADPALHTASSSHLGERPEDVARVAETFGIPLLSAILSPQHVYVEALNPPWLERMTLLCRALGLLDERATMSVVAHRAIEVHARGHRFDRRAASEPGVLHVAGSPAEFCWDATPLLVAHYRLEQRGEDVPAIVETVMAAGRAELFVPALRRLALRLGLEAAQIDALFETPVETLGPTETNPSAESMQADHGGAPDDDATRDEPSDQAAGEREDSGPPSVAGESGGGTEGRPPARGHGAGPRGRHASGKRGDGLPPAGYGFGPRPRQDSGDAPPHAPGDHDDDDRADVGDWPNDRTGPDAGSLYVGVTPSAGERRGRETAPTDGPARAAVMEFERLRGRQPTEMGDYNEGYDVESWDPASERTRRIEIKSMNSGVWRDGASVYLSEAQFRAAATNRDPNLEYWLYVVDSQHIHPVPWRQIGVARFLFYGRHWAELAEDIGERDAASAPPTTKSESGNETTSDEALFEPDWWPAVTAMREANLGVNCGTEVTDADRRVIGQTVGVVSRADIELVLIDDDAREADVTELAIAATGAAFIRTRADRAASDVLRWFDERAG